MSRDSKNSDKGCWLCNTYTDMDDESGFFEMLKKEHEAHDLSAKLGSIIEGKEWRSLVAEIDWYDGDGEIHYDYVMNEWGPKSSRVHELGSFLLDISQQYVADMYGGEGKKAFANYPDGKIDVVDMGHTVVVEIPNVYDSEKMNKLILTEIESDEWDAEEFGAETDNPIYVVEIGGNTWIGHDSPKFRKEVVSHDFDPDDPSHGNDIDEYLRMMSGPISVVPLKELIGWMREKNPYKNWSIREMKPDELFYLFQHSPPEKEYLAEGFEAEGISEGRYMWKLRFEFDEGNISWDDDVLPLIKDYTGSWDSYGVGFGNVRVVVQSPREVVLQKLKADLDDHLGGYIHYGAEEFGADSNQMRRAVIQGIINAMNEGYVSFSGDDESCTQTVILILDELAKLQGASPVEIVPTTDTAMRIDPYDVVAAMAQAALQMDESNEETITNLDFTDRNLSPSSRRLGWGLQSIFGIHALTKTTDVEVPMWRVSGYPQAIDSWYVLYNTLRVNLAERVEDMTEDEKEQFYQAFATNLRDNDNVADMITANASHRRESKNASREWIQEVDSISQREVGEEIEERARVASTELNPFGADTPDEMDSKCGICGSWEECGCPSPYDDEDWLAQQRAMQMIPDPSQKYEYGELFCRSCGTHKIKPQGSNFYCAGCMGISDNVVIVGEGGIDALRQEFRQSFEASINNRVAMQYRPLKKDSCCCGATKSNPCECMYQGIDPCSSTCPCSLERK